MAINTIDVENNEKVLELITELKRFNKDLRPVFETISSDFYKSNEKLIFSARPGRYADLKATTKKAKQRKVGFVYPILVQSGRLKKSLTKRGSGDAVEKHSRMDLAIGTRTPYAGFLQQGTKHMKARPPLLIEVGNRVGRWTRILQTELDRVMEENA